MADTPADSPAKATARQRERGPGQFQDQLSEEYTIDTPENVTFGYEVAGIGSRFIAALIDSIILVTLLVGLNIVVLVALGTLAGNDSSIDSSLEQIDEDWVGNFVIAIYALLNFAIWWGYYMLFEWLWHGQTIGKRAVHLRVVRTDGAPVSFVPVAVRNLVRVVDFLPVAYAVGVVTMFCNRQSRRLGDFAAGTLVVMDQGELTLDALMTAVPTTPTTTLRTNLPPEDTSPVSSLPGTPSTSAPELSPNEDWSNIRRLTPADYELVQETLARYHNGSIDMGLLRRVATAIATKLDRSSSSQVESVKLATTYDQVTFLRAVAAAYGRWVK
jgi:uncharacterized RDD family membrane protein YckC